MEQELNWDFADFIDRNMLLDKDLKGDNVGQADYDGYTLLGMITVGPGRMYGIGWRRQFFNPLSGGIVHVELYNTEGNRIEGQVKIVFKSADGHKKIPVYGSNTRTQYYTDPNDRSKQQLVCYGLNTPNLLVKSDGQVQLLFKPETDDQTINKSNTSNKIIISYLEVKP